MSAWLAVEAPTAGWTWVWVCLRGFCGQSKSGPPKGVCAGWVGSPPSLDPSMAQKVEEEQAFPSANPTSICSCPETSGTLLSGLSCFEIHTGTQRTGCPSLSQASDSAGSCSLAVLGPQPAGSLWGFSVSITTDTDSYNKCLLFRGFPGASVVKGSPCQCRRPEFDPWVGKTPWRRKWPPAPVFLPGESHGQRSLAGCSPWGGKESAMTELRHIPLALLLW